MAEFLNNDTVGELPISIILSSTTVVTFTTTGTTFSTPLFGDGSGLTGLPSSVFNGGTVTGATNFTNGLTANTISATTLFGDGSGLTGVGGGGLSQQQVEGLI